MELWLMFSSLDDDDLEMWWMSIIVNNQKEYLGYTTANQANGMSEVDSNCRA